MRGGRPVGGRDDAGDDGRDGRHERHQAVVDAEDPAPDGIRRRALQPGRRERPLGAAAEVRDEDEAGGDGQAGRQRQQQVGAEEEEEGDPDADDEAAVVEAEGRRGRRTDRAGRPSPRAAKRRPMPTSPASKTDRAEDGQQQDHAAARRRRSPWPAGRPRRAVSDGPARAPRRWPPGRRRAARRGIAVPTAPRRRAAERARGCRR